MSTISGVGGSSDAWAQLRSQLQAKIFAKADQNGDGSVGKSELSSFLSNIDSTTGTSMSGNVDQTFSKMDTDGDGKLSSSELASGMQNLFAAQSTMDFAQQRVSSDSSANGDGSGGNSGNGGGNPVDALFSQFDTSNSGSISSSSVSALAAQIKSDTGVDLSTQLTQAATDNGGKITKSTLESVLQQNMPAPPDHMGGPNGGHGGNPVDALFSQFDTSNSGSISSSSVSALAAQIKSDTGVDLSTQLAQAATDNGGKITKSTLQSVLQENMPAPPDAVSGTWGTSSSTASTMSSNSTVSSTSSTSSASNTSNSSSVANEFADLMKELYAEMASSSSSSASGSSQLSFLA